MAKINPFDVPPVCGYRMDPRMPLHQLACKRIHLGRDLKIIITAEDSETGVGKTTAAGWLAIPWTKLFTGNDWFVVPENPTEGMGALYPHEYFKILGKVGNEFNHGTVVVIDDAEELDARRSMQNLNVKFSQRWMLMRLKQAITILTLPSPSSIDTRLEELADVWINITRRGHGIIHDIRVQSYGKRKVMTKKKHSFEFPNIADHPEIAKLRDMKENKIDDWDAEEKDEDIPDPDEVERQTLIQTAQRMRNNGMTAEQIAKNLPYKRDWVYKHTKSPESKEEAA